jgi:hypothetical protein
MDNARYHSAIVDKALALNIKEADAVVCLLEKNVCMMQTKLKLNDWAWSNWQSSGLCSVNLML